MTLRHLKIFIAVAENSGMRKAAEQLGISQPAVTQAIQELEAEYKTKLFERLSQKVYMTTIGERLLPYARQAVGVFDQIHVVMMNNSSDTTARIGASSVVGMTMLNEMIDQYEIMSGSLEAEVVISDSLTIIEMIQDCRLDFAIIEGGYELKDMIKHFICEDELVLVVGKQHPFYNRESIQLSELDGATMIYREESPDKPQNPYIDLIHKNKITIRNTWLTNSVDSICDALIHNRGIAIISKLAANQRMEFRNLKIIPVDGVRVIRNIYLVYHKDKKMSDALIDFIKLCNRIR